MGPWSGSCTPWRKLSKCEVGSTSAKPSSTAPFQGARGGSCFGKTKRGKEPSELNLNAIALAGGLPLSVARPVAKEEAVQGRY